MKTVSTIAILLCSCLLLFAGPINRKTFSLSLPTGWTENTHDNMYNPDSFVFFERGETGLFTVIIADKTTHTTAQQILRGQESGWRNRLTNLKFTDVTSWGRYKGSGTDIEGDMQEVIRVRTRIFAFESAQYVCVVTESASVRDWNTLQSDFEEFRKSFRLK